MEGIKNNSVSENVSLVSKGSINCNELASHYADAIDASDAKVCAWEHYDRHTALEQAAQLDDALKQKEPAGCLHGIPVGVKDIFDTVDFPTCLGSPIHAERQPEHDCTVIEKLKAAKALIIGKTVTTEFAYLHPSKTRNPHNPSYSPGGSSSGSAAAVAAGHVPLAVGSQTGGSVIRPASFCGVYGYKPTRGLVSRRGVLETSTTLDHVGFFASQLEDMAAITDAVCGYDPEDSASLQQIEPDILSTLRRTPARSPSVVWLDLPYKDRFSDNATDVYENLISELGTNIERIAAPDEFRHYLQAHKTIYDYEIYRALSNEIQNHWGDISPTAQPIFAKAKDCTEQQYRQALDIRHSAIEWFDNFYKQYDAVLTPSAISIAPLMGSTGDAVCCTTWTLCGLPCINLPICTGENNLPIGIQVVGAPRQDGSLFQTARYIEQLL